MRAILTPDDLKKGDLAEVGWHPSELVDYDETSAGDEAKSPGSTNCNFYFKILDGPSKGITAKRLINETAMGFGKSLWVVFYGSPDPVKGYTAEQLNTESFKAQLGKKLMIYIKRGKSNRGNEFNDVADFRPMS